MECKKCGKIIDQRSELKFCTGCGAEIKRDSEPQKKEDYGWTPHKKHQPVGSNVVELDTRTRAFYVGAALLFIALFIVFQFSFPSAFLSFIAALACSVLGGTIGVIVISRSGSDLKNMVNDGLGFIPAGGPVRRFVEALSSSLFPTDGSKEKKKKKSK